MIQPPNREMEKTYQHYIADIRQMDLPKLARRIGLEKQDSSWRLRFFNTGFNLLPDGFYTDSKNRPPYDIRIVLCKYLLLCPGKEPKNDSLVSFRDFKDSGPLTVYFSTDVETLIRDRFRSHPDRLKTACEKSGGRPVSLEADYDLVMRFDALPKIPMVLLFNDRDDMFDAQAKILFEQRAEQYLDAECLAILGNLLFQTLDRAGSHSK